MYGLARVRAEHERPEHPYTVPAGGGVITQWQTNTTGDAAGATLTLVVLRPGASGTATVVGTDRDDSEPAARRRRGDVQPAAADRGGRR